MAVKKKIRIPRSHKGGLMVSLSPQRGPHLYFQKRPSGYNQCVATELRGKGGGKGSTRKAQRDKFTTAVSGCAPKFHKAK